MRRTLLSILLVLFSFNPWFFLQNSQSVHAKTLGVCTTIPAKFRGNWYSHGHRMTIKANSISGWRMLTTRGKVYRLTSRQSIHMKPSNKVIYIWNQGKRLEMAPRGWQANGFWIVRRNGKRCLLMQEGADIIPYYKR